MAYTEQEIKQLNYLFDQEQDKDILFDRARNDAAIRMGMPLTGDVGRKMYQLAMLNQSGNIGSTRELNTALPDEQAYKSVERVGEVRMPTKKKKQQEYLTNPSQYTSRMMSGLGNGYNYGGFNYGN